MAELADLVAAIEGDQFDWGEFGLSEGTDRFEVDSHAKPNFFISCHAVFALVATAHGASPAVDRFDWVVKTRAADGWWTSAAGVTHPRGRAEAGAVRNLRHTAKGLDVLALRGDLRASDAPVLAGVMTAGLEDGSWPSFEGGEGEIWATAYVLNLLTRLIHGDFDWLATEDLTRWREALHSRIVAGGELAG